MPHRARLADDLGTKRRMPYPAYARHRLALRFVLKTNTEKRHPQTIFVAQTAMNSLTDVCQTTKQSILYSDKTIILAFFSKKTYLCTIFLYESSFATIPPPRIRNNLKQKKMDSKNFNLLELGIEHHEAERYTEAFKCFEAASNDGNVKGMYQLALCYLNGEGVDKNEKKAFQLLTMASDLGDEDAQFQLAECYYQGKGTRMDLERAMDLYLKTAKHGNKESQFMVGFYLMRDHGGIFSPLISRRDTVKAFEWFYKSAEQGYHPAQRRLGAFYESGTDPCVRNLEKAESWYLKAAEQGNEKALFALGRIYANGIDEINPDYPKAFGFYLRAAKKGLTLAQYRTGVSYLYGKGVDKDIAEAKKWLALAAKQHHRFAEAILNAIENNSNDEQNDPLDASYYELAFAETDEYGVLYSKDWKKLLRYSIEESMGEEWISEIYIGGIDYEFGELKTLSLTNYNVKEGTELICDHAFCGCESIYTITLPDTIKQIGDYAFLGCNNLESIVISEGIKSIGNYAFEGCINLLGITLPRSLERIGHNSFQGVKEIKSLTNEYIVKDNCLYNKDEKHLIYFFQNGQRYLEIPYGVETIEESAFEKSCISKVILPSSLKKIEWGAFANCKNLIEVTVPESVKEIGSAAFYECTSLVSIKLPECLTVIEGQLFDGCENLSHVHIPNNVKEIKPHSFFGTNLKQIILPQKLEKLSGNAFSSSPLTEIISLSDNFTIKNNAVFCDDGKTIVLYYGKDEKYIIPDGVETIADFAFSYAFSIREFIIPQSIKQIGRGVLNETLPKKILAPTSVLSIVKDSFPNYYTDHIFELKNDCH